MNVTVSILHEIQKWYLDFHIQNSKKKTDNKFQFHSEIVHPEQNHMIWPIMGGLF